MIHLCYKKYPYKLTLGASKRFFDKTGLDLQTVLMDYLSVYIQNHKRPMLDVLVLMSKVYTRDIASYALYCVISEEDKSIPIEEIDDATFRVSWVASNREDELSEPWPIVMYQLAIAINDYQEKNIESKKTGTLAESVVTK